MRKLLMLCLMLMLLSPLFFTSMARADVLDGLSVPDETTAKKDSGPRKPAPKPGPRDGDDDDS